MQGVVYDSLRGAPLKDALVAILGVSSTATTDDRGRFSFDGVPSGTQTLVIQHPALDSMGFSGLSRRIAVSRDSADVRLGLPSFATLWRTACGERKAPTDSGLVFGTIRNAIDGKPVADAFVDLTWIQVSYQRAQGLRQRSHRGATRSDAKGGYVVCGVPMTTWLRVDAAVASGASGRIDMPPARLPVQRRDLLLGPTTDDESMRGSIVGHVADAENGPMFNARVVLDDTLEVRSGPDGRFVIPNVRIGTRQLEFLALGAMPVVTALDVLAGDTAMVTVRLRRVTTLDVVQVTASRRGMRIAAEIAERQRMGVGHAMEVGELQAHGSLATAFGSFPGATIARNGSDFAVYLSDGRGGRCPAEVWIDGAHMDYPALNMIRPREVVAVELVGRASEVPLQYRQLELKAYCGVLLVWTNWAFGR